MKYPYGGESKQAPEDLLTPLSHQSIESACKWFPQCNYSALTSTLVQEGVLTPAALPGKCWGKNQQVLQHAWKEIQY